MHCEGIRRGVLEVHSNEVGGDCLHLYPEQSCKLEFLPDHVILLLASEKILAEV